MDSDAAVADNVVPWDSLASASPLAGVLKAIAVADDLDFGLVDLSSFADFELVASFVHSAGLAASSEDFVEPFAGSFADFVVPAASSEDSAGPVASFGDFADPFAGSFGPSEPVDSSSAVVAESASDAVAFVSSVDPYSDSVAFVEDSAGLDSDSHPWRCIDLVESC